MIEAVGWVEESLGGEYVHDHENEKNWKSFGAEASSINIWTNYCFYASFVNLCVGGGWIWVIIMMS